jgi:gamma-glutamylcyclotransferase (GGCT)/AIG2-like uncharacterized protein YtfP
MVEAREHALAHAVQLLKPLMRDQPFSGGSDVSTSWAAIDTSLGGPSRRLATYGTLSPGGAYHRLVSGLAGRWIKAMVDGELDPNGWGLTGGYPGFRWRPGGASVQVYLLESADLPDHWERLDEFEGPAYRRMVVPVMTDEGVLFSYIYGLVADKWTWLSPAE